MGVAKCVNQQEISMSAVFVFSFQTTGGQISLPLLWPACGHAQLRTVSHYWFHTISIYIMRFRCWICILSYINLSALVCLWQQQTRGEAVVYCWIPLSQVHQAVHCVRSGAVQTALQEVSSLAVSFVSQQGAPGSDSNSLNQRTINKVVEEILSSLTSIQRNRNTSYILNNPLYKVKILNKICYVEILKYYQQIVLKEQLAG